MTTMQKVKELLLALWELILDLLYPELDDDQY